MIWTTSKRIALAEEILDFLKKHGVPDPHEPDCLFSPDANQLQTAASMLKMGRIPTYLESNWENGGYQHYKNVEAKEWHDRLVNQVKDLMTIQRAETRLINSWLEETPLDDPIRLTPDQRLQQDIEAETNARIIADQRFRLGEDILDFLKAHAKLNPNHPTEYNSPDANQLFIAAELLKAGKLPTRVWSDWSSGGYQPYTSDEARKWHDRLVSQVQDLINS